MFSRKLLLLLAALGSAGSVLAQRLAVAPLAPSVVPVAAPQPLGVDITNRPPARPAAPVPDQPSRTSRPQPVYIINGTTIIGGGLAQLNPQDIADLQVYKDNSARVPANWRRLTANGIIAITLKPHRKPKFKTESLAAIGRRLKLHGPVSYQLEGQPLEDLSLRVVTADIAWLDAQPTASGTVVNIRLAVPPPAVHPPGTIMIRGATGL
jgi:hypothetical protein